MDKRTREASKQIPKHTSGIKGSGRKAYYAKRKALQTGLVNKIRKLKKQHKLQPTNQQVVNALKLLGVIL